MNFNDHKRNRIGTIVHDCDMKNPNTKYISVKELDKIIAHDMKMLREQEKKKRPHVFVYIYYRICRIMFSDKNRINATVI